MDFEYIQYNIFLLVLVFFSSPMLSHCCHECIWQDVSFRQCLHTPYPDRTRGCSIGCDGGVLNDVTCTPGGPQACYDNFNENT